MGKGGGDGSRTPRGERYCVPSTRKPPCRPAVPFGGNVTSTTDATDGSQASASQSQNQSSVVVEELVPRLPGEATERAANSVVLTPDSVVVEQVPNFPGQAKKLSTPGVPNPDSEALGCLNEGSETALDVQSHEALLHGHRREDPERAAEVSHVVTRAVVAFLLSWARSLDHNLRQKLCEHILRNGEKAGQSSSKGNLAESSDASYAKLTKLAGSKNFPGVRKRKNSIGSQIRLPGRKSKFWLGTYKTEEEAARAFLAAVDWRKDHRDSKPFKKEDLDDLKKRAEKAVEHLSDDRSHHNVASPDLATTSTSFKGKAVASPDHVASPDLATTSTSFKGKAVASPDHVASPDLATTSTSFKGKAVASPEHVASPDLATTSTSFKGKAVASLEHVSQRESPWNSPESDFSFLDNFLPELDSSFLDNVLPELDSSFLDNVIPELDSSFLDNVITELDLSFLDNGFSELDLSFFHYFFGF